MYPNELPKILNLQDKIITGISDEVRTDLEREFRQGSNLGELAEKFLPEHQIGVAKNTVRLLLQDIIPEGEYKKLTKGRGPRKQGAWSVGIHGQTRAEKQEAGVSGAIKSGAHPYDKQELSRLLELVNGQECRLGTRIHADKIAGILNGEFHGGSDVRNSVNVRKQVSRIRRKKELL